MQAAEYWIEHLQLFPHPEGGFYKETYRAEEKIPLAGLPDRFRAERNFSTAIYFLLRSQDRSVFHRIKSDELWHFHAGSSLAIYAFINDALKIFKLGARADQGENLQVVIPANCWFGAKVIEQNSYVLAGCTVAPGFDFNDFEIATREELLHDFPNHHKVIQMLT